MTRAPRLAALVCALLTSTAASASSVTFDLPTTDTVNRSNVAFLVFGGACSQAAEQVTVAGPSGFLATAQCRDTGRWEVSNVSLTHLADGTHTFTAEHPGAAAVSRTLRKDTVAPLLSLQQPANGSSITAANQSALPVRGTCGELNQPVVVSARPATASAPQVERQLLCPTSRSFATTLDVSGLPDGDVQVFVQHQDSAGNTAQQDIILFKDAEPLQVTLAPVGPYISAAQSASLHVQGTCNKPGEALYLDVLGQSGYLATLLTACGADGTWALANVSVTDAPDEELVFIATLTHSLTGDAVSVQASALKDTVPPVLALLAPVHGSRITAATGTGLQVSGTCTGTTPVSVRVGQDAPAEVPCAGGTFSLTHETAGLPDGDVPVRVMQADEAGNVARQDVSLLKDVQPAQVAVLTPSSGAWVNAAQAAAVRFSGTCSEHGSFAEPVVLTGDVSATAQCVGGQWSVTLALTEEADGPLSLTVSHRDTAGNPAAVAGLTLHKDVVPPVLHVEAPWSVNAETAAGVELRGTCSEDGREVGVTGARSGTVVCLGGGFVYRPDLAGVPDGDVRFDFTLTDAAGNGTTQSAGFFKDTQPPAVALSGTGPLVLNAASTVSLTLQGTCTESGDFATPVRLTAPVSALAACSEGSWTLTLSLSELPEGEGTLRVEHRDVSGNLAFAQRAYVKDTVAPLLALTEPAASGVLVNAANQHALAVSGTCDEEGRSVTLLTPAGLGFAPCAQGRFGATVSLASAPDGDVLIRAHLEDALGNATEQDVLVYKDAAPPVLTLENPGEPLVLNAGTAPDVLLTGTCSEWGDFASPVRLVAPVAAQAACDAGTWLLHASFSELADGGGTLEFEHVDRAGNRTRLTRAFLKDTQAPGLTLTQPGPGFFVHAGNAASVQVAGTCGEEGGTVALSGPVVASAPCTGGQYSVNVDLTGAADGDVTLRASLSDAAGNTTVQDVLIHKDTAPPSLTLDTAGDPLLLSAATAGGVWLFGSCSEHSAAVELVAPVTASAACTGASWSLWVSLSELADGTGSLRLEHRDTAGNTATVTRAWHKDTVAPALALTRPAVNERIHLGNVASVQVEGTCGEEGRPVEVTAPVSASALCTGGQFALVLDLGTVPDGDVAVRTRHADVVGNATLQDVLVLKDTVPPVLTLANEGDPLEVAYASGNSLVLSGTCSEAGALGQPVRFISPVTATAACTESGWSLQLNVDAIPMGQGSFTLTHEDGGGNTTRLVRPYIRMPPAPKLTVTSHAPGSYIGWSNLLQGTCSEDGRPVELLAPSTRSATCWNKSFILGFSGNWMLNGPTTLKVRHTNAQGTATLVEIPVIADMVSPVVRMTTQPSGWDLGQAETLFVQGTCSEPGRPVTVMMTGTPAFTVPCTDAGAFTATVPLSAWGTLSLLVTQTDLAGNQGGMSTKFERCQYAPRLATSRLGPSGRIVQADFNGDGLLDLAAAMSSNVLDGSYAGGVRLYLARPDAAPGTSPYLPPVAATEYGADSLTVADFNGDGALDLLLVQPYGPVWVATGRMANGRPAGTFNAPFQLSVSSIGVAHATHVNDDDIPDLITVGTGWQSSGGNVYVAYGRVACGPGIDFGPPVELFHHDRSGGVATAAGDFNGDGRLDVVVMPEYATGALLLGTPPGSAAPFQPTPLPSDMWMPLYARGLAADVNGDTLLDLVTSSRYDHIVTVRYGTGQGGFGQPSLYAVGPLSTEVAVVDVNGDGRQDLLAGGEGSLTVLPGLAGTSPATYGFGPGVALPTEGKVFGLAAVDFDGDSLHDILATDKGGQRFTVHSRPSADFGPEPFHPAVSQGTPYSVYGPLVTADFDGDGILDIANVYSSNGKVSVWKGQGTGAFSITTQLTVPGAKQLVPGDFDEDGAVDLAVLAGTQVLVFPGGPAGTFAAPMAYALGLPSDATAQPVLVTADFNGDGVLDLLAQHRPTAYASQTLDTLVVLPGRGAGGVGDGTFAAPVAIPLGTESEHLATPDLDRDGRADLVVIANILVPEWHGWRQELRVLRSGAGGGSLFGPYAAYPLTSGASMTLAEDFNADGVLDLMPVSHAMTHPSEILYGVTAGGVPTGTFTSSPTLVLGSTYAYQGLGGVTDFDGDGALDLLLSGASRLQLVRRAPGAGASFQAHRFYTMPGYYEGFVMGDFNGDGVKDVAVSNGQLVVMLGRSP